MSCLERGQYFHKWDHAQRSKKDGGKVYIEIRHDGTVTCHEGYVTQAEARRLDRAASGEINTEPTQIKPEMSGPMADYIGLHRHGAARASLLNQPAIALRLMVAHAMTGSALWDVKRHAPRSRKEDTLASLESSKASQEMRAAQENVNDLFEALNVNGAAHRNGDSYRLCEVFAALLAMSDDEVMQVLAFTMADTLEAGGAIVEAVAHVCETDMASYWKPEPAFFDLLRNKRAINAMVADIGTVLLADSCAAETAKAQKMIIGNRIMGEGCEPNPDWRPSWMRVPPTRLVEGAACAPVDAWNRIKGLFETAETENDSDAESLEQKNAA
ncbi:MAG: hypothetical protein NXH70_07985 [Hyphomonas sp.]|nr:hypothetical protein [Hyphomonas sp.]